MIAAGHGRLEICVQLIEHGAHPNFADEVKDASQATQLVLQCTLYVWQLTQAAACVDRSSFQPSSPPAVDHLVALFSD